MPHIFCKSDGVTLGRLLLAVAGLAAWPAGAQDSAGLTGVEVSRDSEYAYLGWRSPCRGGARGKAWSSAIGWIT